MRVERPLTGLPAPTSMSERHIRTIIDSDPRDRSVLTLDDQTRTVRTAPRPLLAMTIGGRLWFSVPVGGVRFLDFRRAGDLLSADPGAFVDVIEESLGIRRIAGVETTGRRTTIAVPPWYHGNAQPIEMVDERWESAELNLLVLIRQDEGGTTMTLTPFRRAGY